MCYRSKSSLTSYLTSKYILFHVVLLKSRQIVVFLRTCLKYKLSKRNLKHQINLKSPQQLNVK